MTFEHSGAVAASMAGRFVTISVADRTIARFGELAKATATSLAGLDTPNVPGGTSGLPAARKGPAAPPSISAPQRR